MVFNLKILILNGKRIRGPRNRIVHAYFGIDYKIVWSIIENNLEGLIYQLEALIEDYEEK